MVVLCNVIKYYVDYLFNSYELHITCIYFRHILKGMFNYYFQEDKFIDNSRLSFKKEI